MNRKQDQERLARIRADIEKWRAFHRTGEWRGSDPDTWDTAFLLSIIDSSVRKVAA